MNSKRDDRRFAVSFTTIPTRLHHLEAFIKKIDEWTVPPNRIFLTLSRHYLRFNQELNAERIPDAVLKHPNLEILWRDDLGPINKLFWVLLEKRSEFDFILSLDDDRDYPPSTSKDLLDGAKKLKDSVVCFGGRVFKSAQEIKFDQTVALRVGSHSDMTRLEQQESTEIDILLGTDGVLYPTHLFDSNFFDTYLQQVAKLPSLRFVDDIYISGYLASRDISIRLVPSSSPVKNFPRWSFKRDLSRVLFRFFRNGYFEDRLWAINKDGHHHDLAIAFWSKSWRIQKNSSIVNEMTRN